MTEQNQNLRTSATAAATDTVAIAIDGPAASGKSTLGAALARRLGYLYLDTGVMYRAVTLAALRRGIPLRDEAAIVDLARRIRIDIRPPAAEEAHDGRQYTVLADCAGPDNRAEGMRDITWELRLPEVDAGVSIPSAYPAVRAEMVQRQRQIARQTSVVMVGRDIGTIVLPDADLKIYLNASVEERARRRYEEIMARGGQADYAEVLSALRRRDALDSTREQSPLRPADDAIIVDSTGHSPDEVLDICYDLVRARLSLRAAQKA
ncbi:MAG: (d)CMP kinase [Anaerolineae bacterium]